VVGIIERSRGIVSIIGSQHRAADLPTCLQAITSGMRFKPQCNAMVAKRLDSPCVDVCKLDSRAGICIGCLRTIDEIVRWAQLSAAERRSVLADIPRRKDRRIGVL
jgi:predicted Fe-S protein YdhL (DUF1289 family)